LKDYLPIGHLWNDIPYGSHKCIRDFHFHSNLNYLKEVQSRREYSQYILLLQEIQFLYKNCNNIRHLIKHLLEIFEKKFKSYPLRISVSSFRLLGNLTHLSNISGRFSASTTSLIQRDTDGCDKTINLLLPVGDWYDPVAKKFNVTRI